MPIEHARSTRASLPDRVSPGSKRFIRLRGTLPREPRNLSDRIPELAATLEFDRFRPNSARISHDASAHLKDSPR
jgi:hypothetical protein